MSAKKKSPSSPTSSPAATVPVGVPAATVSAPVVEASAVPWIESPDPRRRLIARIAFVAVWIYVAALWLLALDQWFNWGIFGPKVPPLP